MHSVLILKILRAAPSMKRCGTVRAKPPWLSNDWLSNDYLASINPHRTARSGQRFRIRAKQPEA